MASSDQRNLLGLPLEPCSMRPLTGYFRTGCCETDDTDLGRHVVCAGMIAEFLAFSASRGSDPSMRVSESRGGDPAGSARGAGRSPVGSTPRPGFAGLRPGDRWCLCASRWKEALEARVAPPVILAATNEAAKEIVSREVLLSYALDSHSLN